MRRNNQENTQNYSGKNELETLNWDTRSRTRFRSGFYRDNRETWVSVDEYLSCRISLSKYTDMCVNMCVCISLFCPITFQYLSFTGTPPPACLSFIDGNTSSHHTHTRYLLCIEKRVEWKLLLSKNLWASPMQHRSSTFEGLTLSSFSLPAYDSLHDAILCTPSFCALPSCLRHLPHFHTYRKCGRCHWVVSPKSTHHRSGSSPSTWTLLQATSSLCCGVLAHICYWCLSPFGEFRQMFP